jgi:hypothetical protein
LRCALWACARAVMAPAHADHRHTPASHAHDDPAPPTIRACAAHQHTPTPGARRLARTRVATWPRRRCRQQSSTSSRCAAVRLCVTAIRAPLACVPARLAARGRAHVSFVLPALTACQPCVRPFGARACARSTPAAAARLAGTHARTHARAPHRARWRATRRKRWCARAAARPSPCGAPTARAAAASRGRWRTSSRVRARVLSGVCWRACVRARGVRWRACMPGVWRGAGVITAAAP